MKPNASKLRNLEMHLTSPRDSKNNLFRYGVMAILLLLIPNLGFGKSQKLKNANQLANVLKANFAPMHQWVNKCETETSLSELNCYPRVTKSNIRVITCVGKGLDMNAKEVELQVAEAGRLVQALKRSGLKLGETFSLKNLSCLNTYSGFANCGSGRNEVECTVEK